MYDVSVEAQNLDQSVVPCPVLTVASWPAYRFHRRQVRWSGTPNSLRIFYCDPHSQRLWHSQWSRNRYFSGIFPLFFMIQWMLAIWFLVPLPFLNPAWTFRNSQFMYCWSLVWRILSIAIMGFPCGSAGKESTCNAGDLGSIPGLGRSPGEGNGYSLQYSGLENSMDCIVHGIAKSQTWLNDFHFTC